MRENLDEFREGLSDLASMSAHDTDTIVEARWELMRLLLDYSMHVNADQAETPIHLFKAKTLDKYHVLNGFSPDNGWCEYTRSTVDVYDIDGDHLTLLEGVGMSQIITILNKILGSLGEMKCIASNEIVDIKEYKYASK